MSAQPVGYSPDLDRRFDRALDELMSNRSRLMDVIATLDTDELYYRLTGERRGDTLAAMELDKLEAFAGTGK